MLKVSETAELPSLNGWRSDSRQNPWPEINLCRVIPKEISHQSIEAAVQLFVRETDVKGDPVGFYNQTLESIAGSTILRKEGSGLDFWLVQNGDRCCGYVLASISKDVDNRLCYWISQAWLHPFFRQTGAVKYYWEKIRSHALESFCKHIVIVSGRGDKAYQRLLGGKLHVYATLIKEDI